ncbi:MAG: sodium:solute symporter, partial [Flammeovirgaceae bacterium]
MDTSLVSIVIVSYFALVFLITYFTARGATSETFFTGERQSPWYIVAFGMIGASLSGVTFISVPGAVHADSFSYMQMVLGFFVGYLIIANILLPLYYRLNLISIYQYLDERFGFWSYKTGAFFFLLSRTIGASFRLYLVALCLQVFLFDKLDISFHYTVFITIALIWLYTFRGGIKTIVWTDTLQTGFMLAAVGMTIYIIAKELSLTPSAVVETVAASDFSQVFFFDGSKLNFFKQFFAGVFIAVTMTGLDQDMMQKNLTCRNIGEAKKNMLWFSIVLIFVNIVFLALGALLYIYAQSKGIDLPLKESGAIKGDHVYPLLANEYLGTTAGIVFLFGIVAAAYSSADSALTALTTSFCIDFLDFNKSGTGEAKKRMRRIQVHLMFSVILFLVIVIFNILKDESVLAA